MPTGGYFLLDAVKTFAAQENWQIRDKVIVIICPICPLFYRDKFRNSLRDKMLQDVHSGKVAIEDYLHILIPKKWLYFLHRPL